MKELKNGKAKVLFSKLEVAKLVTKLVTTNIDAICSLPRNGQGEGMR